MEHISTIELSMKSLFVGSLIMSAKVFALIETHHIAPIVIETLQVMSYGGAFVVSVLTAYNFISKKRKGNDRKA